MIFAKSQPISIAKRAQARETGLGDLIFLC